MVERIKKPSAPSNYAKNKVDDQISLAQQTEERWLHSVIINSRSVFNRKSSLILTAARLRAIQDCCSCANLTSSWRLLKSFGVYLTTGAIRSSSNTTLMRCCAREFIRSPQAMRIVTTPIPYAAIPLFRLSLVNRILWPLNPRSRVWRITPTSKPMKGLGPQKICSKGTYYRLRFHRRSLSRPTSLQFL
jgi:hypothetical protein